MVLSSYPPFRPAPWLSNPHVQTVAAYLSRHRAPTIKAEQHLIELPDGDRIAIHDSQPANWITGDRIAILVHGLCGSSDSPYMRRTAAKLLRTGVRVVRVDMRGWGASQYISRGHAHAGSSADLSCVVAAVQKLSPISKITLVGFSLGGNMVLHLAGQWGRGVVAKANRDLEIDDSSQSSIVEQLSSTAQQGESSHHSGFRAIGDNRSTIGPADAEVSRSPFRTGESPEPRVFPAPQLEPYIDRPLEVDSVIAVSPPVDLAFASANLRHWGNRLYDWFFIDKLRKNLLERRARVPNLLDNQLASFPKRLVHFDDRFLAPVNGFSGARDYYTRASAAPLLAEINIPTLIVSSEDDPVVPARMFRDWQLSSSTELLLLRQGGHLGYFAGRPYDPDPYWLDWRLAQWIGRL
ncbi:MAG: YheT family hydrolase [Planctomycetota bacterium]